MKELKLKHSIIILIILLGLSITVKKTFERFNFGCKKSCIYYNNCKIVSDEDSCTYLKSKGINESGNTDIEFKFSGLDTLWLIISEKEVNFTFKYNSIIEAGDFKVVIINPDNSISNILDNSQEGEMYYLIQPGETKVRIVGNKAVGRLKLTLCYNEEEGCVDVISSSI